jgi:hypothetical protein
MGETNANPDTSEVRQQNSLIAFDELLGLSFWSLGVVGIEAYTISNEPTAENPPQYMTLRVERLQKSCPGGFLRDPPRVLEFCKFFSLKGVSKQGPSSLSVQLDIGIILYLLINFGNFFWHLFGGSFAKRCGERNEQAQGKCIK